jgi:hypothetical protein
MGGNLIDYYFPHIFSEIPISPLERSLGPAGHLMLAMHRDFLLTRLSHPIVKCVTNSMTGKLRNSPYPETCAVSLVNTIDTANISPNRNEISEGRSIDRFSFMDDLREDKKFYPLGAPGKRACDRTAAFALHDRRSAPP